MAIISEIPDDDSNDDHPNKKRKVEGNKKPQEEEEEKLRYELPEELTLRILSHVSRFLYAALIDKCRALHQVITSPELYEVRARIGNTEPVLYALIGFPPHELPRWYILNRPSFRLGQIRTPSPIPHGATLVTVGYEIYVIGGAIGGSWTQECSAIDCRFHTFRMLRRMRRARYRPAAGVIDGRMIYVFGGCGMTGQHGESGDTLEVFDLRNQTWTSYRHLEYYSNVYVTCAMIQNKIYVLGPHYCFTYHPNSGTWDPLIGWRTILRSLWQESSCVVDDLVLCTIDPTCRYGFPIVMFDVRRNLWIPVTGVVLGDGPLNLPNGLRYYDSKMASVGTKIVILGSDQTLKEIWCVEITLERQDLDGSWSGRVESVKRVFTSTGESLYIEHCRIVTV